MGTGTSAVVSQPRRRSSIDEAQALVGMWRSSGEGKESWCRARGLKRSTLWSCLKRVAHAEQVASGVPAAGFIAMEARAPSSEPAATAPSLVVEVAGGLRIIGLDVTGAVAVVQALRASAS